MIKKGKVLPEQEWMMEQLLQSRNDLADAQKIAKLGSWTFEFATSEVKWSEELFRIFGLDPAEEPPSWPDGHERFYHPDDWQRSFDIIEKAFAAGESYSLENRIIRISDGSVIYTSVRGFPRFTEDGNITGYIGTIQDITQQKQIENELWENKQKFRDIITNLFEAYYSCTLEGLLLDHNAAFTRIFGFDPNQDMTEVKISDLWQNPQERSKYLDKLMNEGFIRNYLVNTKTISGEKIVIMENSHLVKDENGKVVRIEGTLVDFTKQTQVEEALRESEERYRELFENINSGVAVYEVIGDGQDFIFKDFNRAGEMINNDQREKVIGRSIFEVRPGVEYFGLIDVFRRVWQTGEPSYHPVTLYHDNKLTGWYENFVYKLPSGEIVAVFDDFTGRKQAEEELIASTHQLRSLAAHLQSIREEERKVIAREIHDEFGQVLSALKINLSTIEQKIQHIDHPIIDQEILKELENSKEIIGHSVKNVRRLIAELRPEVLDVHGLFAALEWLMDELSNQTKMKVDLRSTVNEINFDQAQNIAIFRLVQEAFNNIANHAKATKVQLDIRKQNNELVLKIKDNGIGFNVKNIDQTKSFGLLGMRERTLLFGGTLEVKSTQGKGTELRITIPFNT